VAMRSWRWLWGSQEVLNHDGRFRTEWKEERIWLCDELSIVPEVDVDVWEPVLAICDMLLVILLLDRDVDLVPVCGTVLRGDSKLCMKA